MVETQSDQAMGRKEDAILELPTSEVQNDSFTRDDLEDSSSIVYSELHDDEERNVSELLDTDVPHSAHAVYEYEDAAPEVQQRQRQRKPYRRNSIVDQIMTWAGAIRDDDFYNSHNNSSGNNNNNMTQNTRSPLEDQMGRRASVHGTLPTQGKKPSVPANPLRRRVASSDDVMLLDHDDGLEHADVWNLETDDYDDDDSHCRNYDYPPRRNSLHAMIERAMAHVNLTKNYDDDDLTPFGNRRDSLF